MKINRWVSRRRLPEDEPTLAGLVADLKVLHQVSPPRDLRPRLASDLQRQPPPEGGMIPFPSRQRAGTQRTGGRRKWLTQGIAAAIFITVLALVTGTLTFSVRQATTSHPQVGATDPASGIPKGAKIQLTIDNYVQSHIVEPTLTNLIRQYSAVSGSIIVERPSDGAIIAMDSQPNHDPRTWQQVAANNTFGTFPNPASNDAYTPGQTIMSLLVGIGLDTGSFNERTSVNDSGTLKTDGVTIWNWCYDQCGDGGYVDVATMLQYASNIAAAQFAKLIPLQEFYQYLDRFGFGRQQLGSGLPRANRGTLIEPYTTVHGKQVPNRAWRPAYRDLTAFGQGVPSTPLLGGQTSVTPTPPGGAARQVITATSLQIANAYAALANGGRLMQPHLVRSYSLNGKTTLIQPIVLDQVFQHKDTAQRVTSLLVKAQVAGEGCEALVPGYDVATKTSTSGIYPSLQTIGTTVAYGPVGETNPARRFVVMIELKGSPVRFGSETAAPGVSKILRQLFQRHGLQPDPKSTQPKQACQGPNSPAL